MKLGEGREETGDSRADKLEESRMQDKVSEKQVEGPGERPEQTARSIQEKRCLAIYGGP